MGCFMQGVLIFKGDQFSLAARMRFSFAGVLLACILLIILVKSVAVNQTLVYALTLATIVLLSMTGAVMQVGLMGYCASLSPALSAAAMVGLGVSGVLTFGLSEVSILSKLNLQLETTLLFVFCSGFTVFSWCVCERCLIRNASVPQLLAIEHSLGASDTSQTEVQPEVSVDARVVLKTILPQALNVFAVFAVSLCMFPGVVTKWKPGPDSHFNKSSLTTLITGMFQVFDVVGRYSAAPVARSIPPRHLVWLVVARFLFIPLFIMGQRSPASFWLCGSDAGRVVLMACFAATNGFVGSCAMMYGPELVSQENRSVAGNAMSCAMVWGIFCGCLLAPLSQLGTN